jgi:predicted TIM-barrel fold metal-dependent hydrolase
MKAVSSMPACDSHFHVFGSAERYPFIKELRYQPPVAPLKDYLAHAQELGIERYVFVQPSAYGRDNSCMLDAMREVGPQRCRGIVDLDEDIDDAELERMHALGVRGVRVNVNPIKPPEAGFAGSIAGRIKKLDARCAERGWMLDFLTPGWLTRELIPTMKKLASPFSVAHLGMFLAKDGVRQAGFQEFLHLLATTKNAWVKLTGVYRISTAGGFSDAAALARAAIDAAPGRVIWGSDYPHLSFAHKAGTVELFKLLEAWAPDEASRRRILVDNPEKCFGFRRSATRA